MPNSRIKTYDEAMRQANREARSTVVALAAIIVVWLVCGFGLSGLDIWIFHTPLWVIGGCVAPWIAAIVAAVVLGYKVFADFDLDAVADSAARSESIGGARQGAAAGTSAPATPQSSSSEVIGGHRE